jgi:hypothetical protein
MATLHFRNAKVEVNGVDLSDHFSSVAINYASEMLDETAFGDSTRIRKGGMKAWSIDATAHQDFAAGELDATLWSLVGTTVCVEVRPQNICSTVVNPIYSGIGVIEKYNPVGGGVGTLLDAPVTIQSAGDLSRNTSAT